MIDHNYRSTWGTGPSWYRLQIWKCDPHTPKTGVLYNFCFIKFSPNQIVEAAEARQTTIRASLTPGVGVSGQIPATNLSPFEEYPFAKFHSDRCSGLNLYTWYTNTHWLLYIRFCTETTSCCHYKITLQLESFQFKIIFVFIPNSGILNNSLIYQLILKIVIIKAYLHCHKNKIKKLIIVLFVSVL